VGAFKDSMHELRNLLVQEMEALERKVVAPAKDARKSVETFRKMVKNREDRKLDWERYKSRTEAIERVGEKSERDAKALYKHRIDLDISDKAYHDADESIKANLPPMLKALERLVPQLVTSHSMVANTLFAHYYTSLHDYCQQHGYPIPGTEWKQVQSEFDDQFGPVKKRVENVSTLRDGRAIKQPFASRPDSLLTRTVNHRAPSGITKTGSLPPPIPGGGNGALSPPSLSSSYRRTPSNASLGRTNPSPPGSVSSYQTARENYAHSTTSAASKAVSRVPSHNSYTSYTSQLTPSISSASIASSSAAAAAAGKKKPPPPPPKRKPSTQKDVYVIAEYEFRAESDGDLGFRAGDRIKVVKKTDSVNDWWEGEIGGRKGSFPANYCKLV
jgi:amphiphysin